ncbi:ATP-binding protein [Amycolatopsis sp. PS_44_ISF1]|uniref:ATP-binding protein n=1 Tax=Amycolatopsis sp. PS_44_ISF1 TaxID=2974917 RepID=UPI0028E05121|nr:ATP-binding protein [Amycolatopsis sp. PS_44_ISF1]MDT8915067.1 DUF87 domain-containing protein [Amycolatopsis sp. PS_44_ISF1]
MSAGPREALEALRADSALTQEHVWTAQPVHVSSLNTAAQVMLGKGLRAAADSTGPSPIGVVLNGRHGAGKTHLLGWFRQQLRAEGYFFLSNLGDVSGFWADIADAVLHGLMEDGRAGQNQLGVFLERICALAKVPPPVAAAVRGEIELTPRELDQFIAALKRYDRRVAFDCQDVARALVLLAADASRLNTVGEDRLHSAEEIDPEDRRTWGFRATAPSPREVVGDVSKLLALTGPCVIAVDQIDTFVAQSRKQTGQLTAEPDDDESESRIEDVADGLMLLHEETRRTLTVVACLPKTWELIRTKAVASVRDRFTVSPTLSRIPDDRVGQELVESWLRRTYERISFSPPHPAWPVASSAFAGIRTQTPREALNRISRHAEACLQSGEIRELVTFDEDAEPEPLLDGAVSGDLPLPSTEDFAPFDARFAELKAAADVRRPLDPDHEDEAMPPLLRAALAAWARERGAEGEWVVDPPAAGRRPPLHVRLRLILDEDEEDEERWSFRAVSSNDGRTAVSRLKNAITASGIHDGAERHLVLIRNTPWAQRAATQEHLKKMTVAGGLSVPVTEPDLRIFSALLVMSQEQRPGFFDWLGARRPASGSELLSTVLPVLPAGLPVTPAVETPDEPVPALSSVAPPGVPTVPVGRLAADGSTVGVPLETLRKHVMIFAGSGSGKTVLIRRLIEECALHGVSSIVLDLNNDLARLGDPWPSPPAGWHDGDRGKAEEYLRGTEVVVWTPGKLNGRPLSFPPLPDFATVLDDPDELEFAINAAVASLSSSARASGRTAKADRGRAVLRQALQYYAKSGGRSLDGLIAVLTDLPDSVSGLANAGTIASDLAENLRTAQVNDPALRRSANPVEPGSLLNPSEGRRARVSVVNFDGIPDREEQQSFVNRLQLELFAWIKKHPAKDRPLGGLLVMDEAQDLAPSTSHAASTDSSIRLASQARKYGLGMILATQAPKAVHSRISGNATTQFFGRQNTSAHIEAARELARNKGRDLTDLATLAPGTFYVTSDGIRFQKVQPPFCLSHHPATTLTGDEVVERARR